MGCEVLHAAKAEVTIDTKHQTREKVHELVDELLRANGAIECGIMAYFSFALGEVPNLAGGSAPSVELKKHGVISVKNTKV